jgi:hypothetical protein
MSSIGSAAAICTLDLFLPARTPVLTPNVFQFYVGLVGPYASNAALSICFATNVAEQKRATGLAGGNKRRAAWGMVAEAGGWLFSSESAVNVPIN